ncbi:MAG: DEAD/DEAH box helicase [Acidobacteria bacterium]|nr:DEAD/DEAH box helicase [Acidobacteriota bacterium]
MTPLDLFQPPVRDWFNRTFSAPTPPQILGWPAIAAGRNALILAPTGSGKTLAAFLWAIQSVMQNRDDGRPNGVEVLYVSPLKALSNDIERNLRAPLGGIEGAGGIRAAVRTGDTPPARRREMARRPPHILITTPESLFILLTGPNRERIFSGLRFVIVDEVHALAGNKRGAHLSLSLERLVELAGEFQRIGLSATVRPAEEVARFLGGEHPVDIIDAGRRRQVDVKVVSAAEDYSVLPETGMWPKIIPELLELIRCHRTTLVFVQNRGQSERVAVWLNESAGEQLAEAYHGSMARAARLDMEARLKEGRLRCLVATSALELGIDIGSIELVIQLQSPKSVTRALQRIGRSGHLVSATSKGRFFPTFRDDLAECAVIARLLETGFLESTRVQRNAVDVLAQQIVACAAVKPIEIDRLYALVRRSYCYHDLPRPLFDRVVEMLAGRNVRELRPAISLDAVNHRVAGLSHSRRLAVLGAGAIPDRGLYPAYLPGKKTKVGELDEEFVNETRVGTAFLLGSSTYRLMEITPNHVIVEPAPGAALPKLPFWKGEGIGRSYELSLELGRFRRELDLDDPQLLEKLEAECRLDRRSAWNLREYYLRQRQEAGPLPNDRRLLVETFPDELGNWRLVIHSVFGGRINSLLEMLVVKQVEETCGLRPESMRTDDGVVLVFPGGERPPGNPLRGLTFARAAEQVKEEVLGSALFATVFRHCASRALLLPRPLPHKRAPLYLSRIRAASLLAQASTIPEFPLVAEAARECLQDVLDYENFLRIVGSIESGEIEMVETERSAPSPFAAALQFSFVAAFLYGYDAPAAERAAQLAPINREMLAQILSPVEMGRLLRPAAIEAVEAELQFRTPLRQARSPEDLLEILVRVGDLGEVELAAVCRVPGLVTLLEADGRACSIVLAGERRWIAAEDASHYSPRPDSFVIRSYLETHGPFRVEDLIARYGLSEEAVRKAIDESGVEVVPVSEPRPLGSGPLLCARPILQRIHRVSLGILRREIEPRPVESYARFALDWQHVLRPAPLLDVLEQLEGFPLPLAAWRQILGARVADLRELEDLVRSGQIVAAGLKPGWFTFFARGRGALFLPSAEAPLSRSSSRLLDYLSEQGPSLMADFRRDTNLTLSAIHTALAELFWAGRVCCDSLGEIERLERPTRARRESPGLRPVLLDPLVRPTRAEAMARFRQAFRKAPGWEGRWSVIRTRSILGSAAPEEARRELAAVVLNRYGVLAREWRRNEESPRLWSELFPEWERGEWRGELRRGHFLDGLAGMQFAVPQAVERLREAPVSAFVLLNTCDPANPYGGDLSPDPRFRISRRSANRVLFEDGVCALYSENHDARWWVRPSDERALTAYLDGRAADAFAVQEINGVPAAESEFAALLLSRGFSRQPAGALRRGLVPHRMVAP